VTYGSRRGETRQPKMLCCAVPWLYAHAMHSTTTQPPHHTTQTCTVRIASHHVVSFFLSLFSSLLESQPVESFPSTIARSQLVGQSALNTAPQIDRYVLRQTDTQTQTDRQTDVRTQGERHTRTHRIGGEDSTAQHSTAVATALRQSACPSLHRSVRACVCSLSPLAIVNYK